MTFVACVFCPLQACARLHSAQHTVFVSLMHIVTMKMFLWKFRRKHVSPKRKKHDQIWPILGHLRLKYVILLTYHASNSEGPHCFVKMIFIKCNYIYIYIYIYQLENGTFLSFTLWTCPLFRLMDFVEVDILRHAKKGICHSAYMQRD